MGTYKCSALRKLQSIKVLNGNVPRFDNLMADNSRNSNPRGALRTVHPISCRRNLNIDLDEAMHDTSGVVQDGKAPLGKREQIADVTDDSVDVI